MSWHRVVRDEALAPGGIVAFDGLRDVGVELIVWRTDGGELVGCDARCPHQWSHLAAAGLVDGEELICLSHWWRFDCAGVGTKRNVLGRVDEKAPVAVHPTRVTDDGWIEIFHAAEVVRGGSTM